jgi:hypothetical protein
MAAPTPSPPALRRLPAFAAVLLALAAGAVHARAQKPQPRSPPVPPPPADSAPADTVRRTFREYGGIFMPEPGHTGLLAGFRVYGPMRNSGYVGLIRAARDPDLLSWTAEVEAGQGGVQVAAGRGTTAMSRLHASVLHTWGNPLWVRPNQTYVGAEVRLGIALFGFGLVGYRRVHGSAPGDG